MSRNANAWDGGSTPEELALMRDSRRGSIADTIKQEAIARATPIGFYTTILYGVSVNIAIAEIRPLLPDQDNVVQVREENGKWVTLARSMVTLYDQDAQKTAQHERVRALMRSKDEALVSVADCIRDIYYGIPALNLYAKAFAWDNIHEARQCLANVLTARKDDWMPGSWDLHERARVLQDAQNNPEAWSKRILEDASHAQERLDVRNGG